MKVTLYVRLSLSAPSSRFGAGFSGHAAPGTPSSQLGLVFCRARRGEQWPFVVGVRDVGGDVPG